MIELADAIRQLRSELNQAFKPSEYDDLHFELGPIEFEIMVGLASDARGSGRLRFWVIELGSEAKANDSATQRLRLTLQPKASQTRRSVEEVLIGDDFRE